MKRPIERAIFALGLCLAAGCGGGGGSAMPQKSATVTFGLFSNFTTHLAAVDLSARLPVGVEPTLVAGSNQLRQPELRSAKGQLLGTYSSASRKVNLKFVGSSLNIGTGPFATLECTVTPGFTLTVQDFTGINTPFPFFRATGIDLATVSSISTDNVLAGKVTPTLEVGFGY